MKTSRVRTALTFLVAFVFIGSSSTVANAAQEPLRGGGKAIVRIDAPKIDVEEVGQNQYRITLPSSAKGQWLGTRQKTLMIGELTARDLVKGWSALGHKRDSKVATTIKWKPAGAKVQFMPVQISQAKKFADGRTAFVVTSVSALPSQLTNASLNLARASGPALRNNFPQDFSYSLTDDLLVLSTVLGQSGPAIEKLTAKAQGDCWSGSGMQTFDNVECYGTSIDGRFKTLLVNGGEYGGQVLLDSTITVTGESPLMSYSATVALWGAYCNWC
jgi:hypothetical protein